MWNGEVRREVKVNLSLCLIKYHAMKTYGGEEVYLHAFLTPAPDWLSGQLHTPAALNSGKNPWYSLDRKLGGAQSRSGRGGEEKNSQPPAGNRIPVAHLVA
jgi:hypothetical protein